MSPLECEFLFRCYYSPVAQPEGEIEASFCRYLESVEVVYLGPEGYSVTPLGEALVQSILRTPFPRVAYIGPDGKEIRSD